MTDRQTYYTVRVQGDTGYYKSGDEFSACSETMLIGEHPDCNIRFKSPDGNTAEYYAAIIPNGDDTWRIVPMSQYVTTCVSGHGAVNTVCTLNDGDRISFSDQKCTLVFRKRHDAAFNDNGRVIVSRTNNTTAITLFLVTILVVCAVSLLLYNSLKQIKRSDLEAYAQSVYTIQVDSVKCILCVNGQDERAVWTEDFADGHHEVGTAFITDDGRLITARHCVEYWLGNDPDMLTGIAALDADDLTRRIAEAETYNYVNADSDTTYIMRSYCHVWNEADPEGFSFASTDQNVHINRERDDILVYDDFDSRYYWRSITPHHLRNDMALGDLVTVDIDRKGNIHVASADLVDALDHDAETGLLGFPGNGMEQRTLDFTKGTYSKTLSAQSGMIATKGEATHGFSGGPVFVADGNGFSVIGVLSKVDPINPEIKYSVPVFNP